MSSLFLRSAAALVAAAAVAVAPVAAQGAPHHLPVPAADPAPESAKAASWLASQLNADGALVSSFTKKPDVGLTTDALLGFLGANAEAAAAQKALNWTASQAATYTKDNPTAAAKLAIVATATGTDAKDFGGVNLVEELAKKPSGEDSAFGVGLRLIAHARTFEKPSQELIDTAVGFIDAESGRVKATWDEKSDDLDGAGMLLAGLEAAAAKTPEMHKTIDTLTAWLEKQAKDGKYWPTSSPANSAGVIGTALETVGKDVKGQREWLASQQLANGALPNQLDGGTGDASATAQGMWLLNSAPLATVTGQGGFTLGTASGTDTTGSDEGGETTAGSGTTGTDTTTASGTTGTTGTDKGGETTAASGTTGKGSGTTAAGTAAGTSGSGTPGAGTDLADTGATSGPGLPALPLLALGGLLAAGIIAERRVRQ